MKRLFTIIKDEFGCLFPLAFLGSLLLILSFACNKCAAQSCYEPECSQNVYVGGMVTTNLTGSTCFFGEGSISDVTQLSNWHYLSFYGNVFVKYHIDMQPGTRLFCNVFTVIDRLTLQGGDTIQVNGQLYIDTFHATGANTFILYPAAKLRIDGIYYTAGASVSSQVQVISCQDGTTDIAIIPSPTGKQYYRPGIYNMLGQKLTTEPVGQFYIKDGQKRFILK